MKRKALAASLLLLLGVATTPAWAQETVQVHTSGDVSYVTGGVGEEHAQAMEAVRKDKPRNAYLADIAVTIKNDRGKVVLQTTSEGPFLYVKIPAGRYTVSATHEGNTRTAAVYVTSKGHKHMVFEWTE